MNSSTFPGSGVLRLSLTSLVANWQALRARAQTAAHCAAVVKANAYGCGLEPVAAALAKAGCRIFFVAHLSEALQLRRLLRDVTIYVLNGLPAGKGGVFREQVLQPVIGAGAELQEWLAGDDDSPYALHIDTGMNRLGLPLTQLHELPRDCAPSLVMSHFVSAESAEDSINAQQISLMRDLKSRFARAQLSLANSSGIFLKERPHFDMVRPGYALYGGNPTPGRANPMQPVVTLHVPVLQSLDIPAGASVGYNACWTAKRASRLVTLALGYADGYQRAASNRGRIAWQGALYPVVGRVSMDLVSVDVTGASQPPQRGDYVEVIGPHLSVDDVAMTFNTSGYEVLTQLGARFERVYI